MSINSPESLPGEEPEEEAAKGSAEDKTADGGVPTGADGVGLGVTNDANTFEPEEDPETD